MALSTARRLLWSALALLALVPAIALAQDTLFVSVATPDGSHPNPNPNPDFVYVIDGVQGKELTLERGKTYVFNTDDASTLNHPIMLSTKLLGGDEFVDGVTGTESHQGLPPLVFTPSGTAPDTLYYVCWRHSTPSMGWRIILTGAKTEPDFTVSVATKDASHPYFNVGHTEGFVINGVQGQQLTLERGRKYLFQMDNVSFMHPFYITNDPVGAGALEYGDGVTGNAATGNAVLEFTPTAFAPDTLYYQCQNHPNMGWRILITPSLSGGVNDDVVNAGILSTVAPNPVQGAAEFTLTPPRGGNVRVVLLSADGREVRTLHEGAMSAGVPHIFRLETGAVAPGTYRVQVKGQGFSVGRTVSVVR